MDASLEQVQLILPNDLYLFEILDDYLLFNSINYQLYFYLIATYKDLLLCALTLQQLCACIQCTNGLINRLFVSLLHSPWRAILHSIYQCLQLFRGIDNKYSNQSSYTFHFSLNPSFVPFVECESFTVHYLSRGEEWIFHEETSDDSAVKTIQ